MPGCDGTMGLFGAGTSRSKTCSTITYVGDGMPCGVLSSTSRAECITGGCYTSTGLASSTEMGTCKADAADAADGAEGDPGAGGAQKPQGHDALHVPDRERPARRHPPPRRRRAPREGGFARARRRSHGTIAALGKPRAARGRHRNQNSYLMLRGGRDLKVRPPAGHAGTAPDTEGHVAENRGLAAVADGPERSQAARECQGSRRGLL